MRPLSSAVPLACLLLFAKSAAADARVEAAAQSALKRAATDYRGKRYVAAAARLEKAAHACEPDKCLSDTRAALLRDLGTMQFRHGDTDAASKSFTEALALESDLALNPHYETPDLQSAWDDAKKSAANADASTGGSGGHTNDASGTATPATPEGEAAQAPDASTEADAELTKDGPRYAHFWIGVAGAIDFLVFPTANDLCKLTPQTTPTNDIVAYCTNPDGTDFPSRVSTSENDSIAPGHAGNVRGGLQVGDLRAMVAFDYAFSPSWLVGARVGYVLNTYPGQAAVQAGRAFGHPVHAEVRATYLFGHEPLATIGFAPMLFGGGGISEFDGALTSNVAFTNSVGADRVNIWVTDGPWFVTVGGGFRYQFSPRAAFTAAVRVNAAFGGNGLLPTFGPEIGFQYGL